MRSLPFMHPCKTSNCFFDVEEMMRTESAVTLAPKTWCQIYILGIFELRMKNGFNKKQNYLSSIRSRFCATNCLKASDLAVLSRIHTQKSERGSRAAVEPHCSLKSVMIQDDIRVAPTIMTGVLRAQEEDIKLFYYQHCLLYPDSEQNKNCTHQCGSHGRYRAWTNF